ncbi:MAG: hypothetical protein U0Z44_08015 [Kouleothrix sp.]|jgi:hypothetical protein|nr:hypothetical protein [Kouleothrix sp.]
MATIVVHGIGNHDPSTFRTFFLHVRDQLRASIAERQRYEIAEASFFPVYWGHWGPQAWYQGLSITARAANDDLAAPEGLRLAPHVQAKSLGAPFDPGLAALQIVLSTPGPLHEVMDDLGISEAALVHAVQQTAPQPGRAGRVVQRLLVRSFLQRDLTAQRVDTHSEGPAALQSLLGLILEQPQVQAKSFSSAVSYPFLATVTALARHLRGSIMQLATGFVGDVMLYLARGAEVRDMLHKTVMQAHAQFPGEPLVLIGHSLGGVIAYDYATDPAIADRPPIDLLVTVGAQVALFAEYGLLQAGGVALEYNLAARPGGRPTGLHGGWLNLYDPDDLLSFPIAGIFPAAADGDRACAAGKPFPASHTAYWQNPQIYTLIAQAYPRWPSAAS